eukprot:3715203-Alexandrium_andersonii.AAC.1
MPGPHCARPSARSQGCRSGSATGPMRCCPTIPKHPLPQCSCQLMALSPAGRATLERHLLDDATPLGVLARVRQ